MKPTRFTRPVSESTVARSRSSAVTRWLDMARVRIQRAWAPPGRLVALERGEEVLGVVGQALVVGVLVDEQRRTRPATS